MLLLHWLNSLVYTTMIGNRSVNINWIPRFLEHLVEIRQGLFRVPFPGLVIDNKGQALPQMAGFAFNYNGSNVELIAKWMTVEKNNINEKKRPWGRNVFFYVSTATAEIAIYMLEIQGQYQQRQKPLLAFLTLFLNLSKLLSSNWISLSNPWWILYG